MWERLNRSVLTSSVLRGTVHSLNNMLQSIGGHVELLGMKSHEPHEIGTRVERVLGHTLRASTLIQHLSWVSREADDDAHRADVAQVLDQVMALREYDMGRHRIGCTVMVDRTAVGAVAMRPRQLAVALLNLMINAEQAVVGASDARIVVAVERSGGITIISVADNGPGVPDVHAGAVFEPFFTTGRPGATVGIGLTVARSIVEASGGTVTLVRAGGLDGRGARFDITVPAVLHPPHPREMDS